MVLQRFFHFEMINEPDQIHMKKKRPTYPLNNLDVIQKAELVCLSENTNSVSPKTHLSGEFCKMLFIREFLHASSVVFSC